jgi:hypothetical protein
LLEIKRTKHQPYRKGAFHLIIRDSYGPLVTALPLTLADKTYGLRKDENTRGTPSSPGIIHEQEPSGSKPNTEKALVADTMVANAAEAETKSAPPTPTSAGGLSSGVKHPAGSILARRKSSRDTQHPPGAHENDIGEEGTTASVLEEPSADVVEDEAPTDFTHPAVGKRQKTIWLPADPLGLIHEEEAAIRAMGIDVSTAGAVMDQKGHVHISAAPPDFED